MSQLTVANIRSVEDFYQGVLEVIEENARDAPFGLLFSVGVQSAYKTRSHTDNILTRRRPYTRPPAVVL